MLLDVVEQLQRRNREVTQTQLCQIVELTESGVHRAVMALAARNLLARDIDDYDAAWNVFVTEEGKRLLATTRPIVEALARDFPRVAPFTRSR